MTISELVTITKKPKLYKEGTSFMWTDEHISKQLLEVHLNPDVDLGSRKKVTLEKTAKWIMDTQKAKGNLSILDLGCGPGLYTEFFAKEGHQVTGIDISRNSIEYAKRSSEEKGLKIKYINNSYLEDNLESDKYDLVILIYTDFGVLVPTEREKLLTTIHRILKKGGTFIFDVLKDKEIEYKTAPKTWETSMDGFWRDIPYLALSESFLYDKEKVILFQHSIIDSEDKLDIYRFWTHFFSQEDIRKMLDAHTFCNIEFHEDILPIGDRWNGNNVIFTIASKQVC